MIDYFAGVWGYRKHSSCSYIQNRALRYFLGVHQNVSILALEGDMGGLQVMLGDKLKCCFCGID